MSTQYFYRAIREIRKTLLDRINVAENQHQVDDKEE